MGDKVNSNQNNAEENNTQNANVERKIESDVLSKPINHDGAGPSGTTPLPPLPGSVEKTTLQKSKSKSEHNLRHIITDEDVANALKSISFPNKDIELKNQLNLKSQNETTFVDIKKFMASCFQLKDQINNNIVIELPDVTRVDLKREQILEPTPKVTKSAEQTITDKQKISGSLSEKSDLVGQRDSMSSIGSNVCRICMTRGKERLISPCNCKGSLANVHLTCLERWLNQVGRNHCELCGFSYPAIRTPRYTVLQALRLWFGNPRNRSHLQSDCLIFWLLSTVAAGMLAVCIVGTQYFVVEGNKFGKLDARTRKAEGISHRITETAMNFFMAIVLCGYTVTVYLLWKDHYIMWNRWRRANVNVRLLLTPDSNPVPFVPRPRYNIV